MATSDEYPASTRAWRIQNVVDEIFAHYHPLEPHRNWTSLLFLSRATFHGAVQYAWGGTCDLSKFPWESPSQERLECYRRGPETLELSSFLPHCFKWTIPLLLEYFPRAHTVNLPHVTSDWPVLHVTRTESGAVSNLKVDKQRREWTLNEQGLLLLEPAYYYPPEETFWEHPIDVHDPEPTVYVVATTRSRCDALHRNVLLHGLSALPEVFSNDLFQLFLHPTHRLDTWLRVLDLRNQLGLATMEINLGQKWVTPARLRRLGELVGSSLEILTLAVEPANLDELFGSVLTSVNFPVLDAIELRIDVLSADTGESSEDAIVEPLSCDKLQETSCFQAESFIDLHFRIPPLQINCGIPGSIAGRRPDQIGMVHNNMPYDALEVLYRQFPDEVHLCFESSDGSIDTKELKKEAARRIKSYKRDRQDEWEEKRAAWKAEQAAWRGVSGSVSTAFAETLEGGPVTNVMCL